MALCPRCKKEWLWDWDSSMYRSPGGEFARKTAIVTHPDDQDNPNGWAMNAEDIVVPHKIFGDTDVDMFLCQCGKVISFSVRDDEGCENFDHPEWNKADWDVKDAWK